MIGNASTPVSAFEGNILIVSGHLGDSIAAIKAADDRLGHGTILIFDSTTSHQIEVDLRGTVAEVQARIAPAPPVFETVEPEVKAAPGPGRPKLGVVPREITLLPRHWDWLAQQPGGASVAIRKLVDEAKRAYEGRDRARLAQESAYRFMSTMAGNQPEFEEAARAFFANDADKFEQHTADWPQDVREHARVLASRAFGAEQYRVV